MKTLCLSVMLLLLAACCCDASVEGIQNAVHNANPVPCCFSFSSKPVPPKLVSTITETDRSCLKKAFIVETIKGRQICYRDTFEWAVNLFNERQNTEGSRQ